MSFEEFEKELEELKPLFDELTNLRVKIKEIIFSKSLQTANNNKLFHYTSLQGLDGIIKSSSLWATDSRFLNDSSEIKDGVNALSRHLKPFKNLYGLLSSHWELLLNQAQPHVISFCSEGDLLSQWRAYANEAEGYCIEFDTSDSRLSACIDSTVVIGDLIPVTYENSSKQEIISEVLVLLKASLANYDINIQKLDELSETRRDVISGLIISTFSLALTSFKDSGFAEEKEWRIIITPNPPQLNNLQRFRSYNNAFIPYIEAIFLQDDEDRLFRRKHLPIKSICLPPASGKVSKLGLEMFLESNSYNDTKIIKSSIPLRNKKAIHW